MSEIDGKNTRLYIHYTNIKIIYYTACADFTTPYSIPHIPQEDQDYALEDGLDRILTPALVPKETSDLALGR
jgi:hypothetical protein